MLFWDTLYSSFSKIQNFLISFLTLFRYCEKNNLNCQVGVKIAPAQPLPFYQKCGCFLSFHVCNLFFFLCNVYIFCRRTTKFYQILTDVRATRVHVSWLLIGQLLLSQFFDSSDRQQSFTYKAKNCYLFATIL